MNDRSRLASVLAGTTVLAGSLFVTATSKPPAKTALVALRSSPELRKLRPISPHCKVP